MCEPCTETVAVRFTEHECSLIKGLATLRGMSASDLIRELIGFERDGTGTEPHLQLVPTKSEGGDRSPARACLP